jgi:hypothetical protein
MPQARKTRDGPNEREEGGERDGMACAGSTKMGGGGGNVGYGAGYRERGYGD